MYLIFLKGKVQWPKMVYRVGNLSLRMVVRILPVMSLWKVLGSLDVGEIIVFCNTFSHNKNFYFSFSALFFLLWMVCRIVI